MPHVFEDAEDLLIVGKRVAMNEVDTEILAQVDWVNEEIIRIPRKLVEDRLIKDES